MKTDYLNLCTSLSSEIKNNYELIIESNHVEKKIAPQSDVLEVWPKPIRDFYSQLNGMELHWEAAEHLEEPPPSGRIRILAADQVDPKNPEPFWFAFTPENSPIRTFRLIDYFVDEAAVGFYQKHGTSGEMHLYHFEAEPVPLGVDFEGYVRLMVEARGFFYWQKALVAININKENVESRKFQEKMPLLFPSFSFHSFKQLYYSLRIKKS